MYLGAVLVSVFGLGSCFATCFLYVLSAFGVMFVGLLVDLERGLGSDSGFGLSYVMLPVLLLCG